MGGLVRGSGSHVLIILSSYILVGTGGVSIVGLGAVRGGIVGVVGGKGGRERGAGGAPS